jgi:prepilin-type N-terminal cleavage/methylation domain-containing protein
MSDDNHGISEVETGLRKSKHRGFTITEALIALAVMAGVAALVGQHAFAAIAEHRRNEARAEAVQLANNVLEEARGLAWKELDAAWAKQRETAPLRWPNARMTVNVEKEGDHLKRVTVTITWEGGERSGWAPVTIQAIFATRTAEGQP